MVDRAVDDATQLRAKIDHLIARPASAAEAYRLLGRLWRSEASPAAAGFVVRRFAKVKEAVGAVACRARVLRSFTVEPVLPLAQAGAAIGGIDLQFSVSEFNAYAQEILDPNSPLYGDRSDVVILAVQARDVAPRLVYEYTDLAAADVAAAIDSVVDSYATWIGMLRQRSLAHLIIHNLEAPASASAGALDAQQAGQAEAIRNINRQLTDLAAAQTGVYILDYDALTARHGRTRWFDAQKWLTMRMPITADCLIHLGNEWLRFIHPITGRVAKCLACDLDNTLWGGIIGEDGIDGIELGGEYPGAAFHNVQRAILDLHQRGIILAICSKNNHDDAMEVIRNHPGMLLREEHFSALRINWSDKAQNLQEIARELGIGIDAIAFVDDNPVERELVREMLPQVTVIELPENSMDYADALRAEPVFERLSVSEEDRKRGRMYAEQHQRCELQRGAATLEEYYRSLEMKAEIALVDPATLPRVAQLTQKTNQFNMTTRRYSEQQVAEFAADPAARVCWMRVTDRFGDNGIVAVAITRQADDVWEIDLFLMSCRVIGRTVETAMLATLAEQAAQQGATRLVGRFISTRKNAPAKDVYEKHGFTRVAERGDEVTWEFDLARGRLDAPPWIERQISLERMSHGRASA